MSKMDLTDLSRNYFSGLLPAQANSYVSGDPFAFASKVCGALLQQGPENPDGSINLYAPDGSLAAVVDAEGNLFVRDGDRVLIYSAKPEEEARDAAEKEAAPEKQACEQEVFGSYVFTEAVCLPKPEPQPPEKQTCEGDAFAVVDRPQCAPTEAGVSTQNHALNLFGNYQDLLDRILGISTPDQQSTIYDPPIEESEQPEQKAEPVVIPSEPKPKSKPPKADKKNDGEAAKASTPAEEKAVELQETPGYGESESASDDYGGFEVTFEYGSTEESPDTHIPESSGAAKTASTQNVVGDLAPAFYADSSSSSEASALSDSAGAGFNVDPLQAGIGGILSSSFSAASVNGAICLYPDACFENSKHLPQGPLSAIRAPLASHLSDSGAEAVIPESADPRPNSVTRIDAASLGMLPVGFDSLSDSGLSPLPSFSSARGAFVGGSKDGNAGILSLGFAGPVTEECAASIAEATRGLGGMPHTMFSSGFLSALFTAASDAEHKLHTIADVSHEGHSHGEGRDEGDGRNRDQEGQPDDELFAESGLEDFPAATV